MFCWDVPLFQDIPMCLDINKPQVRSSHSLLSFIEMCEEEKETSLSDLQLNSFLTIALSWIWALWYSRPQPFISVPASWHILKTHLCSVYKPTFALTERTWWFESFKGCYQLLQRQFSVLLSSEWFKTTSQVVWEHQEVQGHVCVHQRYSLLY